MKNKFLKTIVASLLVAAGIMAQPVGAATLTPTFDVNITLTSACTLTTATTDVSFAYTSGQAGPQAATPGSFALTCTNLRPYTMLLDTTTVTDDALNLSYTLSIPAGATGNGASQSHAINGTMAGGQYGDCVGATCTNAAATNKTRTITVSY